MILEATATIISSKSAPPAKATRALFGASLGCPFSKLLYSDILQIDRSKVQIGNFEEYAILTQ